MKEKMFYLFDLDGTVTDSRPGITNSVRHALKSFGIYEPDEAVLNDFLGPPLWESFGKHFGFDREAADRAVEIYREYYATRGINELCVYPGVEELFAELCKEGKKVVLATSKPEHYAKIILAGAGLDKYMYFIGGAEMGRGRSEKGDVIAYCVKEAGIDVSKAVMVGDHRHDIAGAKENNIVSVGAAYGYGSREELLNAGADYIAGDAFELSQLFLKK